MIPIYFLVAVFVFCLIISTLAGFPLGSTRKCLKNFQNQYLRFIHYRTKKSLQDSSISPESSPPTAEDNSIRKLQNNVPLSG